MPPLHSAQPPDLRTDPEVVPFVQVSHHRPRTMPRGPRRCHSDVIHTRLTPLPVSLACSEPVPAMKHHYSVIGQRDTGNNHPE